MNYTVKSGIKEILFVLIWIGLIALIGDAVRYFIPNPPILSDLVRIACGAALVYFIYTRYCAEFTYTLGEEGITAKSRIGRRERSTFAEYKNIKNVSEKIPENRAAKKELYVKSIFLRKKRRYILFDKGAKLLVIEPGNEFMQKLKEKING